MLQSLWWFILLCYIIIWNKDSKWFCCQFVLIKLFQPQVGSRVSRGLLSCPYGYSETERVEQSWVLTLLHPVVNEHHSCTVTNTIHSPLGYVECDTVLLVMNLTALLVFLSNPAPLHNHTSCHYNLIWSCLVYITEMFNWCCTFKIKIILNHTFFLFHTVPKTNFDISECII